MQQKTTHSTRHVWLRSRRALTSTLATGLLVAASSTASAAIIGHWSFEGDSFLQNSISEATLTTPQSPPPATQYELQATGPGSAFFNPNGLTNSYAANFNGTGRFMTTNDVTKASFTGLRTLTVEAMFNANSIEGTAGIASIWASTGYRTFLLSLNDGVLRGGLNYGTNAQSLALDTQFTIEANVDYYVAMVATGNETSDVIFYLMDLTNGGSLQSQTISFAQDGQASDATFNTQNSSSAASIGSLAGGSYFNGLIDEVRIATSALNPDQLMVAAIPEPGTYALLGGLLALAGAMLHRRRRQK